MCGECFLLDGAGQRPHIAGMDILEFYQVAASVFVGNFFFAWWAWGLWQMQRLEKLGITEHNLPWKVLAALTIPLIPVIVALILTPS